MWSSARIVYYSNSVSSNVASAPGTQQHSPMELLEVEQEELLQDELLSWREYREEWVMLEGETDEETYHSEEEEEEHEELNEQ